MRRETLFVCLLLVTAGCLTQSGTSGTSPSPTATQRPTHTTPVGTDTSGHTASTPSSWGTPPFPEWDPPEEPYRHLVVGNTTEAGSEPHTYTIWNHDDESRRIAIRIVRNNTTTLEVTFAAPANYTLTVHLVGTNHSRTITDPVTSFDCNRKWANVAILEGGAVRMQTYQTQAACS